MSAEFGLLYLAKLLRGENVHTHTHPSLLKQVHSFCDARPSCSESLLWNILNTACKCILTTATTFYIFYSLHISMLQIHNNKCVVKCYIKRQFGCGHEMLLLGWL